TLKMPAFEWVHVQLHQQKGMISLSPPTICNSAACIDGSNVTSAVCDASGWAAFQLNAPVILGDAANLLI
ncbi:hypothetical protein ACRWS2_22565, partial [Escherichia coli]